MNYDEEPWTPRPRPVDNLLPGMPRLVAISMKCCIRCGGEAEVFTDYLSEREYQISGFCQSCQNWVFQEPEE